MTPEPDSAIEIEPRAAVTPAVRWLIVANVAVYFLQLAIFGGDNVTSWFALSARTFPNHWWAIGTYMFVHAGLLHLASNMFMLWMFGPQVERLFGTRSFSYFYLWCGAGGAVFHLLFTHSGGVVGASGAVVGVILAYALRWPEEEVYLFGVVPMKARWLAVWMVAVNAGMALADMAGYVDSATAWVTHVGGLAFAWLYLHMPAGSSLERIRQHVALTPDDVEHSPIPKIQRSTQRYEEVEPPTASDVVVGGNAEKGVYQSSLTRHRPVPLTPAFKERERIDDVLDKISRDGINSLTPSELQLLEDVSRRLRNS